MPRKPKLDTSIWTRPQHGSRGPSKAHDHASIAEAAVRIADAEGLEAVSMRRLAAELGAGAASLYRYVANKDELFELMVDSVMARRSPPRPTGHWRDDLRTLANKLRALFLRHPWLGVLSAFRPALGHGSLRWIEAALACVDDLSLDIDEMVLLTNTVSFYVRGYVASELADDEARRRSGMDMAAWMTAHAPYGRAIIDSGAFPRVIRVMRDAAGPHRPNRRAHDFELGLERVLDGIAAAVKSKRKR